ncbi:hypothetical protein NSDW_14410 [Novosphingobium olei]|nr:hypothetical protein NSDW_14410 [Novosphingobium olei]
MSTDLIRNAIIVVVALFVGLLTLSYATHVVL